MIRTRCNPVDYRPFYPGLDLPGITLGKYHLYYLTAIGGRTHFSAVSEQPTVT